MATHELWGSICTKPLYPRLCRCCCLLQYLTRSRVEVADDNGQRRISPRTNGQLFVKYWGFSELLSALHYLLGNWAVAHIQFPSITDVLLIASPTVFKGRTQNRTHLLETYQCWNTLLSRGSITGIPRFQRFLCRWQMLSSRPSAIVIPCSSKRRQKNIYGKWHLVVQRWLFQPAKWNVNTPKDLPYRNKTYLSMRQKSWCLTPL
jgi:hypothetical protein